jgi:hypothetical protein
MPVWAGVPNVTLSNQPAARAVSVSDAIPDARVSYYIPQAGPVSFPLEGSDAIRFFRACPNNDGGSSLPNNVRLKIVVKDSSERAISGIAAADICVLFNGGTAAQGFSGLGADSVIANSQWNSSPLCPDLRCLAADGPTDATGTTYITLTGSNAATPGVGIRNPNRKWGHYDTDPPVYALGVQLSGRLDSFSPIGTYTLEIKNMDWTGGLGAVANQGEWVTITDFNGIAYSLGVNNPISYWKDLDNSGFVDGTDLAIVTAHLNHNCAVPLNP